MLFTLSLMASLTSCSTYVSAGELYDNEVYVEDDNVTVIIKCGTPVYYEGHLHYYIYNGLYWYPFWYENHWYFRSYTRIYPWGYDFHFRPCRSDYRFRPGHHGFHRPDHSRGHYGLPREGHVYRNDNARRPNGNNGIHNGHINPNNHNSNVPHWNHNNGNGNRNGMNNGRVPSGTQRFDHNRAIQRQGQSPMRQGNIGGS